MSDTASSSRLPDAGSHRHDRKAPSRTSVEERTKDSPGLSPLDDEEAVAGLTHLDLEGVDEDEREQEMALAMGAGEQIRRQISIARASTRDTHASHDGIAHDERPSLAPDRGRKTENTIAESKSESASTQNGSTQVATNADSDKDRSPPCRASLPRPGNNLNLSLKRKVLHFTPSWFSVTMGTGVVATLLYLLGQIWGTEQYSPGFYSFIRWPALVFLVLDVAIFLVFASAFITRYILFPKVFWLTLTHPQQSMFLGTIPMGLVTITSNIAQLGTTAFGLGEWPSFVALGLWFVCALLSLATAAGIPWSIITFQKEHRFEGTTAALLLPIVPPITVAASGSVLIDQLGAQHPTLAFTIMAISYMQLGIGLPLAMMVLVIYLQRLILFKAPPREVIVSVFLPLGPCGQGGEAALHLGQTALRLFPVISTLPNTGVPQLSFGVGQALYGAGLVVALLLFALGMWWAVIGTATFLNEYFRGHLKFNMGYWSFTFPLASLCLCTARLAMALDSLTLKIVYTIMVLANVLLWVYVAVPTVKGFVSGRLLVAPCIIDLPVDPLTEKIGKSRA